MSPKPKNVPSRLGPPPQLNQLKLQMAAQQQHLERQMRQQQKRQQKLQPKMREVLARQAKLIARWMHEHLTMKRILMSWMVLLVASKMVLLVLTYQFFTLTALISLQIFHGVWTIAFFCLNVLDTRAVLPNASCLLAGYLPATTVLHILLIPNDYPLEFIITDAVGTFLAIITMFMLLRMECTEILHEAEYMYERDNPQHSDTTSESGLSSTSSSPSTCTTRSNGIEINTPQGRRILGNPTGPTIITVSGGIHMQPTPQQLLSPTALAAQRYESMLYHSMEEPVEVAASTTIAAAAGNSNNATSMSNVGGVTGSNGASSGVIIGNNVLFDEAVDLEPIDFEHFVDEPENDSDRMFQVTLGTSPPLRGR